MALAITELVPRTTLTGESNGKPNYVFSYNFPDGTQKRYGKLVSYLNSLSLTDFTPTAEDITYIPQNVEELAFNQNAREFLSGAIRIIPKQSRVEFSADFKMTSDARSKLERILNVEIKI